MPKTVAARSSGSLGRRMILIAAGWITFLLLAGGFALDRVLANAVTDNFDSGLEYMLTQMIASAEIGPDGEVVFSRSPGDPRFVEPNSGLYFQISGKGYETWPSRSLWDRSLLVRPSSAEARAHFYESDEFKDKNPDTPDETLRIVERDVKLPTSPTLWRFQVAQTREELDLQIGTLRTTVVRSFALLAVGLLALAALQTLYGLLPLRQLRRSIADMRAGRAQRVEMETLPSEVAPLIDELNGLLDHNEKQAEEAREHAGNLAHALKTPLTVIMNAATAQANDLDETVIREAATMRRQVDHHLARARAVGRRGHAHSRAEVWPSLESVERAVSRLYSKVRLDIAGEKNLVVHIERQDLDEILGNLIENAAKYGGGSVFITVGKVDNFVDIVVEDDGMGISDEDRERLFSAGCSARFVQTRNRPRPRHRARCGRNLWRIHRA